MRVKLLLSLAMVLALAGCDNLKNKPVSVETTPLPGIWYGEQRGENGYSVAHDRLLLQVSTDGYVSYHYLSCEFGVGQPVKEKRLDLQHMPITRLNAVKMVLQTFPLTPKFELTLGRWPDENGGLWVVDNIELQKLDTPTLPDTQNWDCSEFSVQ